MPLQIESRPLDELLPDPVNARIHDDRNVAAIRASLRRFGQRKPIVVDQQGVVIAGNGTLSAMRAEAFTHADVVVFPGSAADGRAYALADNRTSELADWDETRLVELLDTLEPDVAADLGWTAEEIAAMIETPPEIGDQAPDNMFESWGVIVVCESEKQQTDLMQKLDAEGYDVRALVR